MPDTNERVADPIAATKPVDAAAARRMPWRPRSSSRSLFAMAAWQRMATGFIALLLLWLLILWATAR